jgi:hypothetical protein
MDEDDFEALRQKRKLELQKKMRQEQDWRQLGHGRFESLGRFSVEVIFDSTFCYLQIPRS